jgi:hypothetical protein
VRKLNGLRRDSEIIFVPKSSGAEDEATDGVDPLDHFDSRRGSSFGRLGGETHLGIFDRPGEKDLVKNLAKKNGGSLRKTKLIMQKVCM